MNETSLVIPIVPPVEAYRLDLERDPRAGGNRAQESLWVLAASYLYLLANTRASLQEGLALAGEHFVSVAFDVTSSSFPQTHPYYWAAQLRAALAPAPTAPDGDKVLDVSMRLARVMEEQGLLILAFNTLDSAGAAFPPAAGAMRARLFLELGGIAARFGAYNQARSSFEDAKLYACEAGQRDLERDAMNAVTQLEQSARIAHHTSRVRR